jgi:hypothetical protein
MRIKFFGRWVRSKYHVIIYIFLGGKNWVYIIICLIKNERKNFTFWKKIKNIKNQIQYQNAKIKVLDSSLIKVKGVWLNT